MIKSSYRIANVWGIPIEIHISLVVLLAIGALLGLFAGPGRLFEFLVMEMALFGSIALHELAHSLVADRKGCRVRRITLMIIGGAAQMERIPGKPKDEIQMAVAGPLMSLAIGAAAFLGYVQFENPDNAIAGFLGSVCFVNWVLAGFNLIPAFPTDGGRVFRAMLVRKCGRLRATQIAVRTSRTIVVCFVIAVLFDLLPPFLSSGPARLILIGIALFLYSAAGNEYRMVQMQEAAKRGGYGMWSDIDSEPYPGAEEDGNDRVIISPPPYDHGPDREAEIRSSDDDPFRNLFG